MYFCVLSVHLILLTTRDWTEITDRGIFWTSFKEFFANSELYLSFLNSINVIVLFHGQHVHLLDIIIIINKMSLQLRYCALTYKEDF